MNVRLLRQLKHNYTLFSNSEPPYPLDTVLSFMSALTGVHDSILYQMVYGNYIAFNTIGYTADCKALCAFLAASPEEIFGFPPGIKRVKKKDYRMQQPTPPDNISTLLERLRSLDDGRMAYVIEARFALIDGREHTLEEIGQQLGGLSRERIRQIQIRALEFLHRFATANGNTEETIIDSLRDVRLAARERIRVLKDNNAPTIA